MEKSRKSQAIVAALMNAVSSSDEDEPAPREEPPSDGEWDILAALRRRGPYPSWDAEWL